MNKSVITTLIQNQINFSVCVALNTFRTKGVKDNSRDYFINILRCDLTKIPYNNLKSRFNPSEDYTALLQLELTPREVEIFKESQQYFNKIIHTKDGRVFELKDKSFKEEFKVFKRKLDTFLNDKGHTLQAIANTIPDGDTKRDELRLLLRKFFRVEIEDVYLIKEATTYSEDEQALIDMLK